MDEAAFELLVRLQNIGAVLGWIGRPVSLSVIAMGLAKPVRARTSIAIHFPRIVTDCAPAVAMEDG